ncbi:unnamed protein product, partial [Cyprideis torosa]
IFPKFHSCETLGRSLLIALFVPALPSEEPRKNPHRGKTFRTFLLWSKISQGSNPKSHEKFHPGEMPSAFSVCCKSFSHLSHLKSHERIHTREKPFPSPREDPHRRSILGKTFRSFCGSNLSDGGVVVRVPLDRYRFANY